MFEKKTNIKLKPNQGLAVKSICRSSAGKHKVGVLLGLKQRYHTHVRAHLYTCRHTLSHMHIHPSLSPHTMMAQSQVQTRACIWNQQWIHITCVVCCLSGSGSSIMNRNIQSPQAGPRCLSTCKGFLKRGTDTQVCHSDACPGLKRQTHRRFPVLLHFLPGELLLLSFKPVPVALILSEASDSCKTRTATVERVKPHIHNDVMIQSCMVYRPQSWRVIFLFLTTAKIAKIICYWQPHLVASGLKLVS